MALEQRSDIACLQLGEPHARPTSVHDPHARVGICSYLKHLPISQVTRSPRPALSRPTAAERLSHSLGLLLLVMAAGAAPARSLGQPQPPARRATFIVSTVLPWVVVVCLSTGLAYLLDTAASRVLSRGLPVASSTAGNDPCGLDVDGVLYAAGDHWLPAGRSAFCRAEHYPGVAGRDEMKDYVSRLGVLQAEITYVGSTEIHLDLYCPTAWKVQSIDADFVTVGVAEARELYAQACS
jgi:hypothetical protein